MKEGVDTITDKDIEECARLAEGYFHTREDPTQLPATAENFIWVYNHFPSCATILKDQKEVVGLTFVLPCMRADMRSFLSGQLNEYELFNKIRASVTMDNFECVYICLAYIKPTYRKRGLAVQSLTHAIQQLCATKKGKLDLFYWAYSSEGKQLVTRIINLLAASGCPVRLCN